MMTEGFTLELAVKIIAALVMGGIIGWQREMAHKPAGFRTHILIVLGATIAMETSRFAGILLGGDPTSIASNIIVGIGFIGAGTIMKEGPTVQGLTTAATIWVAGALGLAIGAGHYAASVLLTASTLLVLAVFARVEVLLGKKRVVRRYHVVAEDSDRVITRIQRAVERSHVQPGGVDFRREGNRISLTFEIGDGPDQHEALFNDLRSSKEVLEVRSF